MSYTKYCIANFGSSKIGLITVGYQLIVSDGTLSGTRQTNVQELKDGAYGAAVTIPDDFIGIIQWDTGDTTPVFAFDDINPAQMDLNKLVPVRDLTSVTTQNIGDCLSAARSDAVGAMNLDRINLQQTLKGPNGEIVRQFLVDNMDTPSLRQ